MSEKSEISYTDINVTTIDGWIEEGWQWGQPIFHETYIKALSGDWEVLLTPKTAVPREWFEDIKGKRLLGLACGGGQQMPIFAAAGAICTVLDYSEKQLESEGLVCEREGYPIEIVRADMTKPLPFEDGVFDIIFNPVSLCYVKDISFVYGECYRVLRAGGILMTGMDNGICYAYDDNREVLTYPLPYDPLSDEQLYRQALEAGDGIQFSHTPGQIVAAIARSGFKIEDAYDDIDSEGALAEYNIPTFIAIKARK